MIRVHWSIAILCNSSDDNCTFWLLFASEIFKSLKNNRLRRLTCDLRAMPTAEAPSALLFFAVSAIPPR